MQHEKPRRSNRERTEATRTALLAAARRLFIEKGYADTATPEIVQAAGVTRGALYHHFVDKQALFEAVVEAEASAVAGMIERSSTGGNAYDALLAGADAFMSAMRDPGRCRILLLDGPAVLGRVRMDELDRRHGARTLRDGLAAAMTDGDLRQMPVDALATVLSASFDRAALDIATGGDPDSYRTVLAQLIRGLIEARRPER